jgi:hypothetical protein
MLARRDDVRMGAVALPFAGEAEDRSLFVRGQR